MGPESYGQFCPIAMAAEILTPRWTLLLIGEMLSGSTRFNEIRRGVPRMSPTLLSKRLRALEQAGLIEKIDGRLVEYRLTDAGLDLAPIIRSIGDWGMRWIDTECTLANLDAQLLMWNMRRKIDPKPLPQRRCVIQFIFPDLPINERHYWLVVSPTQGVDLCLIDPGYDVDLHISADLRALTSAWMGMSRLEEEIAAERIILTGDRSLSRTVSQWMRRSDFATVAGPSEGRLEQTYAPAQSAAIA